MLVIQNLMSIYKHCHMWIFANYDYTSSVQPHSMGAYKVILTLFGFSKILLFKTQKALTTDRCSGCRYSRINAGDMVMVVGDMAVYTTAWLLHHTGADIWVYDCQTLKKQHTPQQQKLSELDTMPIKPSQKSSTIFVLTNVIMMFFCMSEKHLSKSEQKWLGKGKNQSKLDITWWFLYVAINTQITKKTWAS